MPTSLRRRLAALFALVIVVALGASATPVLGHAELVSADPAVGSMIPVAPTRVSATYSDDLDRAKSSLEVFAPDGSSLGKGAVSATDPHTMVATITPPAGYGTYQVRWTSVATDGDVLRDTYSFTVGAGGFSPSASPAESPAASGQPGPADTGSGNSDLSVLVAAAVAGLVLGGGIAWWRRRRGPV